MRKNNNEDKKRNTCERCGDEYESYSVFIRDNVAEISSYVETNEEWDLHKGDNDGFCKPCRMAVTDYGVYLTESEHKKLEPKHSVETEK